MSVSDDYEGFTNCTDNEIAEVNTSLKYLLLTIASSIFLLSFIKLLIRTIFNALLTNKKWINFSTELIQFTAL